jgi:hypothetical protein
MDNTKVTELANHLLGKMSIEQRNTREQLLFLDSQVGRHINQAFKDTQVEFKGDTEFSRKLHARIQEEAEFKLAVYLQVWGEITAKLFTL